MSSRKNLTKQQRQQVYNKYNGHCAYCGCELEYKDMQVDHLIPLNDWNNSHTDEELWSMDNLMPSCRLCNHYKRSYTLEHFREAIEKIPFKLNRDSYIYRIGVKYGVVNPNEKSITFFFEKVVKEKNNSNKSIVLKENIENIVNEKVTVAELMKKQRKNIGLTGKQLSELTGIHHVLIRKYETGRNIPKGYNCLKIASALNIDTQYFFLICALNTFDNDCKKEGELL